MKKITALILSLCMATPAFGQSKEQKYYQPNSEPKESRSEFLVPVVSVLLPGFSQWIEGQYATAGLYSSLAVGGMAFYLGTDSSRDVEDYNDDPDEYRRKAFGQGIYEIAGGISAYQAFKDSVESRKALGQYGFLSTGKVESPKDLLLAPFTFSHFSKPTSYIPLLFAIAATSTPKYRKWGNFHLADFNTALGISYGAGVSEEAVFRGFLLPYAYEHTNSFWIANSIQALAFGAAHISSSRPLPVGPTLGGLYFGWLVRRREWTISESIFVHTWWDVVAIGSEFLRYGQVETWRIQLPPFSF